MPIKVSPFCVCKFRIKNIGKLRFQEKSFGITVQKTVISIFIEFLDNNKTKIYPLKNGSQKIELALKKTDCSEAVSWRCFMKRCS